jgi:hypothetical protein
MKFTFGGMPSKFAKESEVRTFFEEHGEAIDFGPRTRHRRKRSRSPRRVELRGPLCRALFLETEENGIFCAKQTENRVEAHGGVQPEEILDCTLNSIVPQFRLFVSLVEALGKPLSDAMKEKTWVGRHPLSDFGALGPSIDFRGRSENRLRFLDASWKEGGLDQFTMTVDARRLPIDGPRQNWRHCCLEMYRVQNEMRFRYRFKTGGQPSTSRIDATKWRTLRDDSTVDDVWVILQMAIEDMCLCLRPRSPTSLGHKLRVFIHPVRHSFQEAFLYIAAARERV